MVVNPFADKEIVIDSVSGTTDNNGNLTTSIQINSTFILSARYEGVGLNGGVIPMVYKPYNVWIFHCIDAAGGKLANTAVTVFYAHVK